MKLTKYGAISRNTVKVCENNSKAKPPAMLGRMAKAML